MIKKSLKHFQIILILLSSCVETPSPKTNDDRSNLTDPPATPSELSFGQEDKFEIGTWNIENFPKKRDATINAVASHIKFWQLDAIALQEVSSPAAFKKLVAQLPGYQGVITSRPNILKQAFIYNPNEIEVIDFSDISTDSFDFLRPPLLVKARRIQDKVTFNFIVVHLKAFDGSKNQQRRYDATKAIIKYISNYLSQSAEERFIILGDFNAELDQDEMQLWETSNLEVDITTEELAAQGRHSYFNNYRSLIDHIIAVNYDLDQVEILDPLSDLNEYERLISDHLPVVAVSNFETH